MNSQCVMEFLCVCLSVYTIQSVERCIDNACKNTTSSDTKQKTVHLSQKSIPMVLFCLNRTRFTRILLNIVVGKCTVLWAKMFILHSSRKCLSLCLFIALQALYSPIHSHSDTLPEWQKGRPENEKATETERERERKIFGQVHSLCVVLHCISLVLPLYFCYALLCFHHPKTSNSYEYLVIEKNLFQNRNFPNFACKTMAHANCIHEQKSTLYLLSLKNINVIFTEISAYKLMTTTAGFRFKA